MTCVQDSLLEAFVNGELTGAELIAVEESLDACPHCQRRLGELARARSGAGIPQTRGLDVDLFEAGPDPYLGEVLGGRYRVTALLGRGGMGSVYEAEHELIGRKVALKILHPELAARREVLQRFRNEARAAGAIGHPGIVQALDVGRTDAGAPFLVLERLEGRDLGEVLEEKRALPVGEAVALAIAVADAVQAAHEERVVHRDLKPANVFVCEDGRIKVLDFGISKVRGALNTGADTRSGALLGTPAFMAPEQLIDAGDADARSDVYALGAILYRCLTGELPREARSVVTLLAEILESPPPSARARRPEVALELDELVMQALSPVKEERPATMAELRDRLRSLAGHPETGRAESPREEEPGRKAVVVVLFERVRAPHDIRQRVEAAEGRLLDGGERGQEGSLRAVFGEDTWRADVTRGALALALELTAACETILVGPGYLAGGALELAEETAAARAEVDGRAGAFVARSLAETQGGRADDVERGLARKIVRPPESRPGRGALIGRAAELAQLDESLEAAFEERVASVVFIEGPPGIGKSRLIDELHERLSAYEPLTVLAARGTPRTLHSDHALTRSLLEHVPAPTRTERVRRALEALDGPPSVGGAAPDPRLASDRRRLAQLDALSGLLDERPLALLVDDAQWADRASLEALGALLDRSAGRPLLVALAARPELRERGPRWLRDVDVSHVRPRPLRRAEVRSLITPGLGSARAAELAPRVHEHAGGNPFFVEQIALALAARDSAPAAREDERAARADDTPARKEDTADRAMPLPPSVEAAIQARLQTLAPDERAALQRAALLGDRFTSVTLEALGVDDAAAVLRRLVERGLVRESVEQDGSFVLSTPLISEAAYRMLGREAQLALHRAAGGLLEASRAPADVVAEHFERGGLRGPAADAFGRAALEASRRADSAKVIECSARALALEIGGAARLEVMLAYADALDASGRLEEQERILEEADALAETDALRARVQTDRAVALQRLGRSTEALELLQDAVERAERSADPVALARALGKHSAALVYAGRLADAAERLGRAERLVWTKASELRAEAAVWRAQLAAATGDLGARRNAYWAAVELYREAGDLRRHAGASVNLADVYNRVGAFDEAEPALRDALESCRRVGMRVMEGYAWANLGYALIGLDRGDEAERALERAIEIAKEVGETRLTMVARLYHAKILLGRGEADRAFERAMQIVELASERGLRGVEALAKIQAATAALQADRVDEGLRLATEAMALRDELGALEEEEGALFVVLREALGRAGREEERSAMGALGRATIEAAARRIGDPHWRERFMKDVPAHRALLEGAR